jgi:hypothetical protein
MSLMLLTSQWQMYQCGHRKIKQEIANLFKVKFIEKKE